MRPVKKKKPIIRNFANENQAAKAPEKDKVYRFLVMAAAAAVLMVIIRMASGIVAPVLMALFITIILIVPLRWLQQKGLPNVVAMIIVLGCTGIIFAGLGLLVGQSLNDFVRQFPKYQTKIIQKFKALENNLEKYSSILGEKEKKEIDPIEQNVEDHLGTDSVLPDTSLPHHDSKTVADKSKSVHKSSKIAKDELSPENETPSDDARNVNDTDSSEADDDKLSKDRFAANEDHENELDLHEDEEFDDVELGDHVFPNDAFTRAVKSDPNPSIIDFSPKTMMHWVGKFVIELRHLAEKGFIVMIITFFMIFEAARFPEKVDWAMGKSGPINKGHLHHIASEIRRYLFIKSISCLMSSSAAMLVYWAFNVPGYLLWGVVAFFLYFIPNIGGIVAAIIPGLLIFMMMDVEGVLTYAICLVCIECSIGYGIEPKMLGHGLGISTVVIFLSLLWWGWILGPVGLFLAAPLTIMVKIILQAFKETEWIAILLGDKDHSATAEEIRDSQ